MSAAARGGEDYDDEVEAALQQEAQDQDETNQLAADSLQTVLRASPEVRACVSE